MSANPDDTREGAAGAGDPSGAGGDHPRLKAKRLRPRLSPAEKGSRFFFLI